MTSTLYASIDQAKEYLPGESQRSSNDENIAMSLNAASRMIDRYCGRVFYAESTATARTYRPLHSGSVLTDDFHTTTDLVIKTDEDDDGTYETTWSSGDYELWPANGGAGMGLSGVPYYEIRAVDDRWFPMGNERRAVQVTAKWGWAAVPDAVTLACLNLTGTLRKLRDVPLGIAGFQDFGGVRVPMDTYRQVGGLLAPYRRSERVIGIG